MIRTIFYFIFVNIFGGFTEVSNDELFSYEKKNVQEIKIRKSAPKRKSVKNNDRVLKRLVEDILKRDQEIEKLLKKSSKTLIVKSTKTKVTALTRLKGILLNSVIAMNVKPSKFIVKITDDHEELEGAELKCFGHSFQKRVVSKCNTLVLNDEVFEVKIELWDLDGAEGIISDYFYSGEEKAFLTSSFASFLQGVLEVSKDRVSTPYGSLADNNSKNVMLGGLSQVAANANKKITEAGEAEISISYINSGKEVLIFFDESLSLNKESKK